MNRLLIAILFVILVALIVLWMIGGEPVVNSTSVSITDSSRNVFRYLIEPQLVMQWQDRLLVVEPSDDVGVQFQITMKEAGREYPMVYQMVESNPGRLLKTHTFSSIYEIDNTYELEETDGATEIRLTTATKYKSWARILAPLLADKAQRFREADFQRLKQLIEIGGEQPLPPEFP